MSAPTPRGWPTRRSSSGMVGTAWWTADDDRQYRAEVERRFRAHTPPGNDPYRVRPKDRVARSEMRTWAVESLGKLPPETEPDWLAAQGRWYARMGRRVLREMDPGATWE